MNMQQQYYSDEEGPSGDDLYTQEGGKDGNRAPQGPHGPAAAVPPGYVDSSTRSAAHGATQGEAAAILAQGSQLLVHTGGFHLSTGEGSK